ERPAAHPVSPSVPSLQIDVDEDAVVGSIDDLPLVQSPSSEAVRDAIEEPVDAAVDVDDDLALPDAAQLWPPRARRAVAEQETAAPDKGWGGRAPGWGPIVPGAPPVPPVAHAVASVAPPLAEVLRPPGASTKPFSVAGRVSPEHPSRTPE